MTRKRQKNIEQLAASILQDTGCLTPPPINVEKVALNKGLKVISYDFGEDVSGVLLLANENPAIGYNQNNHKFRQRFTIAHELGHYVLGHQREGVFVDTPEHYFTILFRNHQSSTGEHTQEREANAFAAALLMPRALLLDLIKTTEFDFNKDDIVKKLAQKFKVSNQAMAFRLTNLDLLW